MKLGYRSGYAFLNNPKYLEWPSRHNRFENAWRYDQVLEIGAGILQIIAVETSCKNLTLSDIDSRDITAFKKTIQNF